MRQAEAVARPGGLTRARAIRQSELCRTRFHRTSDPQPPEAGTSLSRELPPLERIAVPAQQGAHTSDLGQTKSKLDRAVRTVATNPDRDLYAEPGLRSFRGLARVRGGRRRARGIGGRIRGATRVIGRACRSADGKGGDRGKGWERHSRERHGGNRRGHAAEDRQAVLWRRGDGAGKRPCREKPCCKDTGTGEHSAERAESTAAVAEGSRDLHGRCC